MGKIGSRLNILGNQVATAMPNIFIATQLC